jgi:hypothetical protein
MPRRFADERGVVVLIHDNVGRGLQVVDVRRD